MVPQTVENGTCQPPAAGPQGLAGLLWDVDGTLAETERDGHLLAFNRAFAEAGLPWRWDVATYGQLLAVAGGRERLQHFLTLAEGSAPEPQRLEQLQARKQHHYAQLVCAGELRLRPGVRSLLLEAAEAGIPQAIVTTSGRRAVSALVQTLLADLSDAFQFWICGEDVDRKKPDPQAYALAVQRLQQPPERLLAIEDSPQGLAAATAAGLTTLVTLSSFTASEPLARYATAAAVVDQLEPPLQVHRGPACQEGRISLSYLERLLTPR
ncbi:MAG: HAD-IA family hydrolase [Prochlorococcaceae cyanobacterium]